MEKIKSFTKEVIEKVATDNSYTIGADQTIYGNCPKCEKGKVIETPKAFSCSREMITVTLQSGRNGLKITETNVKAIQVR